MVRAQDAEQVQQRGGVVALELDYLGYRVAFAPAAEAAGAFGALAAGGALRRCWDYALPDADDASGLRPAWNGYARRAIGGS